MINFKKFNEDFFQGSDEKIHWFDRMGVIQLSQEVNAEIEIATTGSAGKYKGYWVTIIHRFNGEITKHFFAFDIFFKTPVLTDKEIEEQGKLKPEDKKILDCTLVSIMGCKEPLQWRGITPSQADIKNISKAIFGYISKY